MPEEFFPVFLGNLAMNLVASVPFSFKPSLLSMDHLIGLRLRRLAFGQLEATDSREHLLRQRRPNEFVVSQWRYWNGPRRGALKVLMMKPDQGHLQRRELRDLGLGGGCFLCSCKLCQAGPFRLGRTARLTPRRGGAAQWAHSHPTDFGGRIGSVTAEGNPCPAVPDTRPDASAGGTDSNTWSDLESCSCHDFSPKKRLTAVQPTEWTGAKAWSRTIRGSASLGSNSSPAARSCFGQPSNQTQRFTVYGHPPLMT